MATLFVRLTVDNVNLREFAPRIYEQSVGSGVLCAVCRAHKMLFIYLFHEIERALPGIFPVLLSDDGTLPDVISTLASTIVLLLLFVCFFSRFIYLFILSSLLFYCCLFVRRRKCIYGRNAHRRERERERRPSRIHKERHSLSLSGALVDKLVLCSYSPLRSFVSVLPLVLSFPLLFHI